MLSNAPVAALYAGIFTWLITLLGGATVFVVEKISNRIFALSLGFSAGVMLAASYFSLLAPAIEISAGKELPWFPAASGFFIGASFIFLSDKIIPHLHINYPEEEKEGVKKDFEVATLLMLAITLHNIPEGLAIGVAFGAAYLKGSAALSSAIALAIGIGLQNFPEGAAIAMPLRSSGETKFKSFFYAQASAIVEPVFAFLGALFIELSSKLLPYALSFAAGAMVFVVIEEVIPESERTGYHDIASISAIFGFVIMLILDVAFG